MLDKSIEFENQAEDPDDNADELFAQSDDEAMGDHGQDADMAMVRKAEFDVEVLSLVEQLGGSSRGYRRDRKRQLRALVSEIYSPPRVTNAAKLLPSLRAMPVTPLI